MTAPSSLSKLRHEAKAGDGLAACQLGDIYREGKGVPQNWAFAYRWYAHAAALNQPIAQNNLATMLLEGLGCVQDRAAAVSWYRKSADQGLADAQWNLAKRYLHGDGVDQDFVAAYCWFEKAARQHHIEALCEMGTMRRFGQGVGRNLVAAADFHLIAAAGGDAVACGNLSEYRAELEDIGLSGDPMASMFVCRMYNRGFGVKESQALTWAWILWAKKSCTASIDGEIADEVSQAYNFYHKVITLQNRKEGERAIALLKASYSQRTGKVPGSNRVR